jgi:endoglucanase
MQVGQTQTQTPTPTRTQTQATVQTSSATDGFYVNPNSEAATQAAEWQASDPSDAAKMDILANEPTAEWFGDWSGDIQTAVSSYVDAAAKANQVPVLVAYDIPQRDCGGYSAGGSDDYTNWIGGFARGIGSNSAIVILEPDALAQASCLSATDQATRFSMLSSAVSMLKSNPNTKVYIDAGHSGWVDPATMASELQKSNIAKADGFSLNVSNFDSTNVEATYGDQVSALVGGKHFVVDTSRNGSGSNGQWCNPSGMTIGTKPTTNTGNSLIDAYLWIKTPGESDGTCNGGPAAGVWWPQYALSLLNG